MKFEHDYMARNVAVILQENFKLKRKLIELIGSQETLCLLERVREEDLELADFDNL